jgi:hypothetical protein
MSTFSADAKMVEAPSGVETSAVEQAAVAVEAPSGVETSAVEQAAWWTAASVEGLFTKSDVIERRMMNESIEVHESIRQIKQLVDTYNHDKSSVEWAAAIVVRELNMFELAERKRLSLELLYVDCKTNNQLLNVEQVLQHNG